MEKQISIKNLKVKNFKGIKGLNIKLGPVTNIYGENGTGKTTVFDAFNFLLFDKDSEDRSKFDVQPLDEQGCNIHHLETEIEGILKVDGQEVVLRKIFKEKWSKTRGKAETEFKGYITSYYINDVPQKQSEYKQYISNLVDENTFKLVTNPMYFANLQWKKRREILLDIIGDIDSSKVINYNDKLKPLEGLLDDGIDNLMKAIKEKIRRLKKDREQIPARIDELNNSIEEFNYTELKYSRKQIEDKINNLDEQIADKSKAGEFLITKREEMFELKSELQEKVQQAKMEALRPKDVLSHKIYNLKNHINELSREITLIDDNILKANSDIEKHNKKLDILRNEYKQINSRKLTIDEAKFICPTCKRDLPEEDIEEQRQFLEENFNSKKANDLRQNKTQGMALANEVKLLIEKVNTLQGEKNYIENEINELKSDLKSKEQELADFNIAKFSIPGKQELEEKIKVLEDEIANFNTEDTSTLKEEKSKLQAELREIDKQLAMEEKNNKTKERIETLEELERELSSKIAQFEGQEILGEEFIRTKVELLEDTVNKKFKYVTFKLFNNLVNGGLEECCEPMVNGVPFTSNLNTAAKINAGIDIINTLSNYYKIQAPIFVDNRESVNKLIETNSQVINLIVSSNKKLKVEVI